MLKSGDKLDREALVEEVVTAPDDTLGNLKRKFLAKYMSLSLGIPEVDLASIIRH